MGGGLVLLGGVSLTRKDNTHLHTMSTPTPPAREGHGACDTTSRGTEHAEDVRSILDQRRSARGVLGRVLSAFCDGCQAEILWSRLSEYRHELNRFGVATNEGSVARLLKGLPPFEDV